jgi:4-azaleucine resistance transporter AzlC
MKLARVFKTAFPYTIPVMTGYLFMGIAFGILLQSKGYSFLWAGWSAVIVFAGSAQFVLTQLLTEPFAPLNTFIIIGLLNARHIFYGFSMLSKYMGAGRLKPYLIFALTDETFAVLYGTPPPPKVNPRHFYFCVSLLNQFYWFCGCVTGALLGARLPMNTQGVDFVMTALFVAIFTEQCRDKTNRIPAAAGLAGSGLCLAVFGPDHFMLPAMLLLILVLTLLKGPIERGMDA